ncbi:hypothetical protein DKP76_07005 [Falsochrobactrum shanghaiense]|uniref:Uncharacterized protein n=1 Tax=Falsochrobactrum shanghaiense TaxID=2201899 RepID=A0A316JDT0_9HYPH|nr:hypothetical protein DKP76_07005 [Falsochrobactrum shanghaiense]
MLMFHGMNQIGKVKTSQSVLTPFFWIFSASLTSACFLFWSGNQLPAYILLGIGALIILMFGYVYLHFMKRDPSRLHSETHIQQMYMIGTIGDPLSQSMSVINTDVSSNPQLENQHDT